MSRLVLVATALLALCGSASAQSSPKHYLSAASNNATAVLGRPSLVKSISAVNVGATVYYLKLFNKVLAPVCGTDVPVFTLALPAAATGGAPVSPDLGDGLLFPLGVGFCITANAADNDNTSAGVGVTLNVGVSAR